MALSVAATMKLGLHFWCGDYAGAVAVADDAIQHIGGMAGTAIMQLIYLIDALSRIRSRAERPLDQAVRAPGPGVCTASGRRAHRQTTRHRMP